ncbi:MAG: MFS transporter [Elusimicrobia bacterium]|nr:MFS transporter [Elusimicrobiota bacterium]
MISTFLKTFRALRHRPFRLFMGMQLLSLSGTWMQYVATSWLMYRLTDSAFYLGLLGFLLYSPSLFLSPLGGVLADRYERRKIMLGIQAVAMGQAVLLAVLTLTGLVTVAWLLFFSLVLGLTNAIDTPVRHSFVRDLVGEPSDMANAVAINSSMFNAARLVGPGIAGVVIAFWGEGVCFLVNAFSFAPVLLFLAGVKLSRVSRSSKEMKGGFLTGFSYAWGFLPIRALLLLLMVVSMVVGVFQTLLPVFARDLFVGGGARLMGYLNSAAGLGAMAGALYLVGRESVVGLGRVISVAAAGLGAVLMIFSVLPGGWMTSSAAFLFGVSMILAVGSTNMVLQTVVDDDKRGRLMSLYGVCFLGVVPLGSLMAGVGGEVLGPRGTLLVSGGISIVAAFLYRTQLKRIRKIIRPVYVERGLLPEA